MYAYETDRLNRYITDVEKWLLVIADGLRYPETPAQAAALSMTRAAVELVAGTKGCMLVNNDGLGGKT